MTILVIIASLFGVLWLKNGAYLLICLLTFYTILFLVWRKNRPGILIFAFLMQWAQVVAYVIWMNVADWDIDLPSKHGGTAPIMACVGLIVMAFTFSQAIKSLPVPTSQEFYQQARLINEKKVLMLYLGSTFFLGGLGFVFGLNSGFAQILLSLSSLKWVFFMIYGYVSWINKKNRLIVVIIILFEFSSALYSYFSSFKEVILITIILALTFVKSVSFRQVVTSLVIGFLVGFMLLTWTAIKSDYREYLNQGSRKQVIEVSKSAAFNKIGEKISSLTWKDYQLATTLLFYRVQYIFHLAKTMDRVPDILPYEYGSIWWNNITFVLEPRLLFPDKPRYEATVKTTKYTGIHYAGFKQGASFSLGYFADSYVDFGYVGMCIPLILISLFVAGMYRVFYSYNHINLLFRFAVINIALYEFTSFEADGLFLFGRLLVSFLVFWALCKWLFPPLQRWLYKQNQ